MAARKKRAARRVEPKPEPKPVGETVVEAIKSRVQSVRVQNDTDPRPAAWRQILLAFAKGEGCPRDLRVHQDERFTGQRRRDQVQAIVAAGEYIPRVGEVSLEEAVDAVLSASIAEAKAQGLKHTETL